MYNNKLEKELKEQISNLINVSKKAYFLEKVIDV